MNLKTLFVRRLKEELERTGISDNELARRSGVGQTTISRLVRGLQDPGLEVVEGIARGLRVPSWYLLIDRNEVEERVYTPPIVSVPRSKT